MDRQTDRTTENNGQAGTEIDIQTNKQKITWTDRYNNRHGQTDPQRETVKDEQRDSYCRITE